MNRSKTILFLMICLLFSCGNRQASVEDASTSIQPEISSSTPIFNADSAYMYVANQVAFGPRVPNTKAHKDCGDYLVSELKRFGAQIYEQEMSLTAYDGTVLEARNIIGSFNLESSKRVLLFAHWDSRPYADDDPDPAYHYTPIDGADDGASGVGVLLEIARQTHLNDPGFGIDIIFFDVEDYGPHRLSNRSQNNFWALGSQFWAKRPHIANYRADYGILLDMVGAKGAVFYKEGTSIGYAAPVVEKIWTTARNIGYGKYFINARSGSIMDDHIPVNETLRIPSVDILNYDPESEKGFPIHWHTMNDTMENIDRETLKAVGQTVLEVVYTK